MNFKKVFSRFHINNQSAATPLQPIPLSKIIEECYDKNLEYIYPVFKVIYADDKTERAVILKTSDALYTVYFSKLYPYDEDELQYISNGLHGYWSPATGNGISVFGTEEDAATAIFSEPPFKYNKSVIWADCAFRIDAENLCWIKNDGADDPDDLCLHGHVFAKIGEEILEYDTTVSAAGLYLLRTLTENHIIHEHEHILPCCGHWMMANEDLSSVNTGGCPNGVDWSVIHENGKIKLVTEAGRETLIGIDDYKQEVYAFADKIEDYYEKCPPKNMPSEEYERNGYTAFWNEWRRHRR